MSSPASREPSLSLEERDSESSELSGPLHFEILFQEEEGTVSPEEAVQEDNMADNEE